MHHPRNYIYADSPPRTPSHKQLSTRKADSPRKEEEQFKIQLSQLNLKLNQYQVKLLEAQGFKRELQILKVQIKDMQIPAKTTKAQLNVINSRLQKALQEVESLSQQLQRVQNCSAGVQFIQTIYPQILNKEKGEECSQDWQQRWKEIEVLYTKSQSQLQLQREKHLSQTRQKEITLQQLRDQLQSLNKQQQVEVRHSQQLMEIKLLLDQALRQKTINLSKIKSNQLELEKMKLLLQERQQNIVYLQGSLTQLIGSMKNLRDNEALHLLLKELSSDKQQKERQLQECREKALKSKEKQQQQKRWLTERESELERVNELNNGLEKKLELLQIQLQELSKTKQHYEALLPFTQNKYQTQIQQLHSHSQRKAAQLALLQGQLTQCSDQLQAADLRIRQLQSEEQSRRVSQLQKGYEETNVRNQFQRRRKILSQKLQQKQTIIIQQSQAILKAQNKIIQLDKLLQNTKHALLQKDSLISRLSKQAEGVSSLSQMCQKLNGQKVQLQKEMIEKQNQIQQLHGQINSLKQSNAKNSSAFQNSQKMLKNRTLTLELQLQKQIKIAQQKNDLSINLQSELLSILKKCEQLQTKQESNQPNSLLQKQIEERVNANLVLDTQLKAKSLELERQIEKSKNLVSQIEQLKRKQEQHKLNQKKQLSQFQSIKTQLQNYIRSAQLHQQQKLASAKQEERLALKIVQHIKQLQRLKSLLQQSDREHKLSEIKLASLSSEKRELQTALQNLQCKQQEMRQLLSQKNMQSTRFQQRSIEQQILVNQLKTNNQKYQLLVSSQIQKMQMSETFIKELKTKLQKQQIRAKQMQEQQLQLKSQIQKNDQQKEALQQRVLEVDRELAGNKKSEQSVRQQLKKTKEKYNSLLESERRVREKVQEQERQLQERANKCSGQEQDFIRLKRQSLQRQKRIQQLSEQYKIKERELQLCQRKAAQASMTLQLKERDHRSQIQQLQNRCSALLLQGQSLRSKDSELAQQLRRLEQLNKKTQLLSNQNEKLKQLNKKTQLLSKQNEKLKEQSKQRIKEFQIIASQKAALKQHITNLQQSIEQSILEFQVQNNRLKTAIKQAAQSLKKKELQEQSLKAQNKDQLKKITQLQQQKESMSSQFYQKQLFFNNKMQQFLSFMQTMDEESNNIVFKENSIQQLTQANQQLKLALSKSGEVQKEYEQRLILLQEKLMQAQLINNLMQCQYKEVSEQLCKLKQGKLQKSRAAIDQQLENQYQVMSINLEKAQQELRNLRGQNSQLVRRQNSLKLQITDLRKTKEKLEKTIRIDSQNLRNQIKRLETQNQSLRQSLQNSKDSQEAFIKLTALTQQNKSIKSGYIKQTTDLKSQLARLKAQNKSLAANLTEYHQKINIANQQIQKNKQNSCELQQKLQKYEVELQSKNQQISQLLKKIKEFQKESQKNVLKIQNLVKLQKQLKQMNKQVSNFKNQVQTLEQSKVQLTGLNKQLSERIQVMQTEQQRSKEIIYQQKCIIKEWSDKNKRSQQSLKTRNKQNQSLLRKIDSLQRDNNQAAQLQNQLIAVQRRPFAKNRKAESYLKESYYRPLQSDVSTISASNIYER